MLYEAVRINFGSSTDGQSADKRSRYYESLPVLMHNERPTFCSATFCTPNVAHAMRRKYSFSFMPVVEWYAEATGVAQIKFEDWAD